MQYIGVDIGGTFTDVMVSENGALRVHKLLSSPAQPARAMLDGLRAVQAAAGAYVAHGSTVATNAILERTGARTALITTQGFRDILAIGRQARPVLYALQPQLPPPLIPRQWCYEVPERLDYTGAVLTPLDLAALDAMLDAIAAQEIEAVAVCLLYSFVNPAHELAIRARMLERGMMQPDQIALSCEVLPEFREYERASTVAIDAYVRPIVSRYLSELETRLPETLGITPGKTPAPLLVMKSDGGVVRAATAKRQAAQTALSGPAAGVIGAFHLAQMAGFDQIITLDVGGTSTDVALCPGAPGRRSTTEIDGLPLHLPVIDIETVGAGGGSLARLDAGGALRVGPASAGANPGPIVYGRGGAGITVSDANAILGRLDPDHFLGGTMPLRLEPARVALAKLATQMGTTLAAAALGIITIANVSIERAVRRVSVERGHDPRAFTLMAFGGAGPLHACEVADRLGIARVLIPRYPGVLCAFGLLVADVVRTYSRTLLQPATVTTLAALQGQIAEMTATARQDLTSEGIAPAQMAIEPLLDMRYRGQSYELTIPLSDQIVDDFHSAHAARYGRAMPERAVEVVNMRLRATGRVAKPAISPQPLIANDGADALIAHKPLILAAGEQTVPLYDRERLRPGAEFAGPALLVQFDTTTFVPDGWHIAVDGYANLIVTRT